MSGESGFSGPGISGRLPDLIYRTGEAAGNQGRRMFEKVLIANCGAIACRIIRTLRRMGVGSLAVHATADMLSLHVLEVDEVHSTCRI